MGAYDLMDHARAGLIDGLNKEIETMSVKSTDSFDFGDPVFADVGEASVAEVGDANDLSLVFAGVAIISQRSFRESQGEYPAYDAMNVLSKGRVWVEVENNSDISNKEAHVIVDATDENYGKFTDEVTNYVIGGFFRSEAILVGTKYLAIVELNGMYKDDPTAT